MEAYLLLVHGLWIVGLAIVLAACSYHHCLRIRMKRPWSEQCRTPAFRFPLNVGFLLVAVAATLLESVPWWLRALWFLLGCSFGWTGWKLARGPLRRLGAAR